jgi:starch synthase
LVHCPALYDRAGGPYADASGADWPDNHLRFATLSMAAAMIAAGSTELNWRADILHANDWQAGLGPAYLRFLGAPNARTVFTIHNMRYQGLFPASALAELQIPRLAFTPEGMEFHGQVSMLKAGLAFADRITTVSPTYAEEIQTAEFGFGMEGLLSARRRDLTGVLNGIDEMAWNPRTDRYLPTYFSSDDVSGKAICKTDLQHELRLEADGAAPLFSMVTRLTEQKGIDLVVPILRDTVSSGAQVAILGAGEAHWEAALRSLDLPASRYAVRIGYDEALAHRMIAGADFFLMPSRFEPCGLTQMYAMRYGTLPVVRRTGGLADTVKEVGPAGGTGVVFNDATPAAMRNSVNRALDLYADKPTLRLAQSQAMQQDFSWNRAADEYGWIYRVLAPHGVARADDRLGM